MVFSVEQVRGDKELSLNKLLLEVRNCRVCEEYLPLGPRPVLQAHKDSKILLVGQAPGTRVHETGIPWNDPSGDRLRDWFGIDSKAFYDIKNIAIIPMGFCYPGRGKSGDLPPRKECSQLWHPSLLKNLKKISLKILVGQYAQSYFLGKSAKRNLTETVKAWEEYLPNVIPLPHPSPRNNIWLKKNPWFESELVPELRKFIRKLV